MKRKLVSILLTAAMVLSLAGCGVKTEPASVDETVETEVESVVEEAEIVTETEAAENIAGTEQAEETEAVDELDGFQYYLSFDVDGTQKVIGFNTPEGYELDFNENNYYKFTNVNDNYFSISPFTEEGHSEESIKAYENYLATGEWKGFFDILPEELLNERIIEVPGGTATILTALCSNVVKNQHVFIDFGGCTAYMSIDLPMDFENWDEPVESGTEEEYIIDDVLAKLFVETENTEFLYPIAESTVEFTEGSYEYVLTYYEKGVSGGIPYFGVNVPGEDFVLEESDLDLGEEYADLMTTYCLDFANSNGSNLVVTEVIASGNPYASVGVYRHFLRTGEITEGVEKSESIDGTFANRHTGYLVDMQIGETVETAYGQLHIVNALWQFDDATTEVAEVALFKVNGKELIIALHNKEVESGMALEGYEGRLKGMLETMF